MSLTKARIVWIAVLAACIGGGLLNADLLRAAVATNPGLLSPESAGRGKDLYVQYCQTCHGADGRGDGPSAASLPTRPEDLTDIAPPPYFPDGVVAYRIANGADAMPAYRDVLTPEQIWDLVNFIRSLHRED
jgi:mono/diheme cytochrome c family protein